MGRGAARHRRAAVADHCRRCRDSVPAIAYLAVTRFDPALSPGWAIPAPPSVVMFGIVPLFGLASAGVSLNGGFAALAQPLPLAVLLGLVAGKLLGVFGPIWVSVRTGVAPMPGGAHWRHLFGAALLCGIGFTMSLFIDALAFLGDQPKWTGQDLERWPDPCCRARRLGGTPFRSPD